MEPQALIYLSQTPQCEGYYANCLLFDGLAPSTPHSIYEVVEKDGRYIIDAGSALGVTVGTQFHLYTSRAFDSGTSPLTVMVAFVVDAFTAELMGTMPAGARSISSSYFAVPLFAGDAQSLRLYIPLSGKRISVMKKLEKELRTRRERESPLILCEEGQATLGIRMLGLTMEYLVYDPVITSLGLDKLYYTTKAETGSVHPVLRSASRFFWNLHRSPARSLLSRKIEIQVHELRQNMCGELDSNLRPPFVPYGVNLLRSGVVDVEADDTVYGMTLRNGVGVPLHIWVFFFDCSDLSVGEYTRTNPRTILTFSQ